MTHPSEFMRSVETTHPEASSTKPGYVLRRVDMPYEVIGELNHNPRDDGLVHRLADPNASNDPSCEFAAGIYRMEPGWRHPLHLHRSSAELYYVLDGVASFTLGDDTFEAAKGHSLYIPAGMPHAISSGDEPMELLYAFAVPDLAGIGTVWLEE
ncbi:MAG: dimethylsulfonioproprionate lyase family protein [Acidimicrobiales bacterium]|nr:dimethylsulfonioproprionate lyase family protein [Acidimicrobiales bacterium]